MKMRFRTIPCIGVFVLAAAMVPAASLAQQPASAPPAPALHVPSQAHQVMLQVTVRDKHGAPVAGLGKSDVALTEDGRAQVVESFTRESNLPFQVGLLVDTSRSMMGAMEAERKAADKFVDQMLPDEAKGGTAAGDSAAAGGDQMFLIHFDREVELLRDFTASREKLHTELEEMGPTSRRRDDREGPETTGDDRQRPRAGETSQLYDAIFLASDELMKPRTGRKALVIFSDGVDNGSKETMNAALDAAERAHVTVYTIYLKGDRMRENPFPNSGRRGGMGGAWPGGGGYPGGGYPGGGYPGGDRLPQADGRKTLEQIATRTGGLYFEAKRKEDLAEIYSRIVQNLRGQYLLTYTPDKMDPDGGFHKIVLKTDKKDLTIVAPEGYFAPGGDEK